MEKLHCVILCGGSGTRLWPLSTKDIPKQFIKINDDTLLDKTIKRIEKINKNITLCMNKSFEKNFEKYKYDILYENTSNDTGVAVYRIIEYLEKYEDDYAIVLPSDHHISNEDIFVEDILESIELIKSDEIVLFGITPDSPESKYGYIYNKNNKIEFKEKPDKNEAQNLIELGALWNSGIFISKISTLKKAYEKLAPNLMDWNTEDKGPSFDVCILQKYHNLVCKKCDDWGWSDIGTWDSFLKIPNNLINTNVVEFDSNNNTVLNSDGDNIVLLGCENLYVIKRGSDILIMNKNKNYDQFIKNLSCGL
jgi:mannose-1-phosphate guanylyltransferase